MAFLTFAGRLSGAGLSYDYGIRDLEVRLSANGTQVLYTVSGTGGGIMAFRLDAQGNPILISQQAHAVGAMWQHPVSLSVISIAGGDVLFTGGRLTSDPLGAGLNAAGAIGALSGFASVSNGLPQFSDLMQVTLAGGDLLVAGHTERGDVLHLMSLSSDGDMQAASTVADDEALYLDGISAMASAQFGDVDWLFVAGADDDGITAFRITEGGTLTVTGRLGAEDGFGINTPQAVECVNVAGRLFVVVASSGSSSLSLLEVTPDGGLVPTDHVIDELSTRFQGVQAMATIEVGGRTYLATGGADDGISLFEVLPGGRLFLLETITDSPGTTLCNVAALDFALIGGVLHLYVTGEGGSENGITHFRVETGTIGVTLDLGNGADNISGTAGSDLISGGRGEDSLAGGAGADVLIDGAGRDTLTGGGGGDTFVLMADGQTDRITDYDPAEDRLDLSDFPQFYGVSQMTMTPTATGAILTFGSEVVEIVSAAGTPLTAAHFTSASVLNLRRSPVELILAGRAVEGTEGDDVLAGTPFEDILQGGSGNDTLDGGFANDMLEGGSGADRLNGGGGRDFACYDDDLAGITVDLANAALNTGEALGDQLISIEGLIGSAWNDRLFGDGQANDLGGGGGDDVLAGRGGADRLEGGQGNDTADYSGATSAVRADLGRSWINTGEAMGDVYVSVENIIGTAFNDVIAGDAGANRLDGGAGIDLADYSGALSGVLVDLSGQVVCGGGASGDVLSGFENVLGSVYGDDLRGTGAANWIHGGAGADTLLGGGGIDTLLGDVGDDVLNGGAGADVLTGGAGINLASYAGSLTAVIIDLTNLKAATGDAAGDTYSGIAGVIGTSFGDQLSGTAGADRLYGGDGNDLFTGRGGGDILEGGAGIDTVSYAASAAGVTVMLKNAALNAGDARGTVHIGIENITGSAKDDRLGGDASANRIDGGSGFDIADYSLASAGLTIDLALVAAGTGEAAGDVFVAIEGLTGSGFNDDLRGDKTANTLDGGAGDDRLAGGAGADKLVGGLWRDTASHHNATAGVTPDLANIKNNKGDASGDTYSGIEAYEGSGFGDTLQGTLLGDDLSGLGGNDRIEGRDGNDTLSGGSGLDTLLGGTGTDELMGGDGDDRLEGGLGADVLSGGAGRDAASYASATTGVSVFLNATWLNTGEALGDTYAGIEDVTGSAKDDRLGGDGSANRLDGGCGFDIADYSLASAGLTIDLALVAAGTGEAAGDVFVAIEGLTGSGFNDDLRGDKTANTLDGGAGDDRLAGKDGNDTLSGGLGQDTLTGGVGSDRLLGGDGFDTASYGDATKAVTIDLMKLSSNGGDASGDTYSSVERFQGSAYGDTIRGSTAADVFDGGAGNDRLEGREGDDILRGAAGADSFVFVKNTGHDTVEDFTRGQDKLVLDDALWAGETGGLAAILAAHSQIVGDDILLTFAGGESILLDGLALAGLTSADIQVI